MSVSISVNYDNRPKGDVIEIPELGAFENGGTYEVDDVSWERYKEGHPDAVTQFPPPPEEDEATKAELYEKAQELDVEGRSGMTKAQLKKAVKE